MNAIKLSEVLNRLKISESDLIERAREGFPAIYVVPESSWVLRAMGVLNIAYPDGGEGGCVINDTVTGLLLSTLRLRLPEQQLEAYWHYPETTRLEALLYESQPGNPKMIGFVPEMAEAPLIKACSLVLKECDVEALRQQIKRPPPIRQAKTPGQAQSSTDSSDMPLATVKPKEMPAPNAEMITIIEVAALLGVSESTVRNYVKKGDGFPLPMQLGPRTVRWQRKDIEAWVAAKRK